MKLLWRHTGWIVTTVFLCFLISASGQNADTLQQITLKLRAGDAPAAVALSDRFLAQHPHDCRVLALRAVAFTQSSQVEKAFDSFQDSVKSCPTYLPALEGASQIAFQQQRAEAQTLLERVLAVSPNNAVAHGMLATISYRLHDCSGALPHLALSEELMLKQPFLRYAYGSCLAQSGDNKAAMEQYKLLAVEHPSVASRYDLAVLEWRSRDAEGALKTLGPLLEGASFAPALELGSRIAESTGDTPRAVALLREAIVLQPDDVRNYVEFARIAFEHNSFGVGVDMLNAGLQRQPKSAPLYLARGVLRAQISKSDEALADFEMAHKLDPKLTLSRDAIGIAQTQAHGGKVPLQFFRDEAQREPNDPLLQYLLAEQASQEGAGDAEISEAIAAAKQATVLDPHYQPAHDLLAKLYVRSGRPELAIAEAELALSEDPDDQEALFQELMATRRTGAKEKIAALAKRLEDARKRNAQKLQDNDRFRLVEGSNQP